MTDGRVREAWGRTASMIAMIHNVNADQQHQKSPSHFMPPQLTDRGHRQPAPPPTPEERELLRQLFPGKKK